MIRPSVFLVCCLLFIACKKQGSENSFDCTEQSISLSGDFNTDLATLNTLHAEIMALIEDRSANKASQCYSMALGAKACGGPATYIIYSSKQVDESALEQKVCYYTNFQRSMNTEYGTISDCAVEQPPTLVLRDGICSPEDE